MKSVRKTPFNHMIEKQNGTDKCHRKLDDERWNRKRKKLTIHVELDNNKRNNIYERFAQ